MEKLPKAMEPLNTPKYGTIESFYKFMIRIDKEFGDSMDMGMNKVNIIDNDDIPPPPPTGNAIDESINESMSNNISMIIPTVRYYMPFDPILLIKRYISTLPPSKAKSGRNGRNRKILLR